jgi:nitrite reductase/ring-hydroxylating ferredoxin subunit
MENRTYDEHKEGCAMSEFVKVAKTGEVASGQGKVVAAGGKRIAIFNIEGTFYAIDDTCTHRGGPLSEGMVVGTEVTCPWHGAVFDVTSGSVLGPPAPRDVARYAVRIEGEEIEVEI